MSDELSLEDQQALVYLRWAWQGAYTGIIGVSWQWSAARCDGRGVLVADTALGLLEAMRADYAARPVKRGNGETWQ